MKLTFLGTNGWYDTGTGLHVLNKFRFSQGIHIYGQEGTKEILDRIINEPYTVPLSKLPFKVDINELPEGYHKIPLPVECRLLLIPQHAWDTS